MADFTANFTLEEIEAIDATFVINQTPTLTSQLTNDSGFITSADVPTTLAKFTDDSTHRLVTDAQISDWNGKQDALGYIPENVVNKDAASGYCPLDLNKKVPLTNIPDSILGQLEYQGVWDASTGNYPTATQKGQYWIASSDGTVSGVVYKIGDWTVYNGATFDKVDNTDAVASVNSQTGTVVLTKTDVGLGNVDNTSDINKPISTETQTALNLKQNIIVQTLTDASSIDWNMASGAFATVTLGGNRALANPTNIIAGTRYTLIIIQDSIGSRTITTYGAYFKFPGGIAPVLTSTANAVDILEFIADTTTTLRLVNFIADSK